MSKMIKKGGDLLLKALLEESQEVLEDFGYVSEDDISEQELAASEGREWFRYNVIMTGRVPLIDEERGKD